MSLAETPTKYIIIGVILGVVILLILIGKHLRRKFQKQDINLNLPQQVIRNYPLLENNLVLDHFFNEGVDADDRTLVSEKSLLSENYSADDDSIYEEDGTNILVDEFMEYKATMMKQMTIEIEGTVTNSDSMITEAVTGALMDDDNDYSESDLTWGGAKNNVEIEACVLCDIYDWLKRKEGASMEDRRLFLQETLNKMIASVQYGIILPDDASRSLHGCAAALGLELAKDIPETTLIVTGMQKKIKKHKMLKVFQEFGDVVESAVSPNERGFGLVRYKSPKSTGKAMERFRVGEIVVQDVAVIIKVLKSHNGNIV